MAQVIHKINDMDDLILALTDLTELVDAVDSVLWDIDYEGLTQEQSQRITKGMALIRVTRHMAILAMQGAEDVYRNRKGGDA